YTTSAVSVDVPQVQPTEKSVEQISNAGTEATVATPGGKTPWESNATVKTVVGKPKEELA
ncbi:MAG: hypothetical protein ACRC80_12655, partial [Waterburya sp.]